MITNADAVLQTVQIAYLQGRTIVFDLDNTLYSEASFLDQAYLVFALEMAAEYGIDAKKLKQFMQTRLRDGGRSTLLQEICPRFGLPTDPSRVRLLHCLRERPPTQQLSLFPWAATFLQDANDLQRCAIITNGNIRQQQNKIAHLPQLQDFPKTQIVLANELAPKPAPDAAHYLEQTMPCSNPLYIGDQTSDAAFARAAGWDFFKVNFAYDDLASHDSELHKPSSKEE